MLLKSLINLFGCGQVYSYKNDAEFVCQSFIDHSEKILLFFRKYPILGIKSLDFKDWDKVAEMIKTKTHLTDQGFDQICQIRVGMHKGRSS